MLWIFLAYQSLGAHFVIFPLVLIKAYGQTTGGKLSSFLYTTRGVSTALGTIVAVVLSSSLGAESYQWMYYFCSGIVLISALIKECIFEPEFSRKTERKGYKVKLVNDEIEF